MNSNTAGSPLQQPISASDVADKHRTIEEIVSSVEDSYRQFMLSYTTYQQITSMLNTLRGNSQVSQVSSDVDAMIAADGDVYDQVIDITSDSEDEN